MKIEPEKKSDQSEAKINLFVFISQRNSILYQLDWLWAISKQNLRYHFDPIFSSLSEPSVPVSSFRAGVKTKGQFSFFFRQIRSSCAISQKSIILHFAPFTQRPS